MLDFIIIVVIAVVFGLTANFIYKIRESSKVSRKEWVIWLLTEVYCKIEDKEHNYICNAIRDTFYLARQERKLEKEAFWAKDYLLDRVRYDVYPYMTMYGVYCSKFGSAPTERELRQYRLKYINALIEELSQKEF